MSSKNKAKSKKLLQRIEMNKRKSRPMVSPLNFENESAIILGNGINRLVAKNNNWVLLLQTLDNAITDDILNDTADLSYPEIFDLIALSRNEYGKKEYNELKGDIKRNIKNWESNGYHKKVVDFAMNKSIPILTTNYDANLLTKNLKNKNKIITGSKNNLQPITQATVKSRKINQSKFLYYSDHKISSPRNEFGIWHIHGLLNYQSTMIIGTKDYTSNIAGLKKYAFDRNGYNPNKTENTISWLPIFFNCTLHIFGLGLKPQETDLRWLFIERKHYFDKHSLMKAAYFYYKAGDLSEADFYFFESVGVEPVYVENYEDMYNNWA